MSRLPLLAGLSTVVLALPPASRAEDVNWDCIDGDVPHWEWLLDTVPEGEVLYLDGYLNADRAPRPELVAQVFKAAELWNVYGGSRVQLRYAGETDAYTRGETANNCRNEVVFYDGSFGLSRAGVLQPYYDGTRMVEGDIYLFSQALNGVPYNVDPVEILWVAAHEFGHMLGLAHTDEPGVMHTDDNWPMTAVWPMLGWKDIECMREDLGYGVAPRTVDVAFTTNQGATWYPFHTDGLESTSYAPAMAAHPDPKAWDEAFLASWTDARGRLVTRTGDGFVFPDRTEVVHDCPTCTSPFPPAVTWAQLSPTYGRWVMSWVSAVDLHVYVMTSPDGVIWSMTQELESPYDLSHFCGPTAVAYSTTGSTVLVGAVSCWNDNFGVDGSAFGLNRGQKLVLWGGSNPSDLEILPSSEESWFTDRVWEIGLDCSPGEERCTLAYRDFEHPDELYYRDLYQSGSNWLPSSAQGAVDDAPAGVWGPRVAYTTYADLPSYPNLFTVGHQESLLVYSSEPGRGVPQACHRESYPWIPDWSCEVLPLDGPVDGHLTVASSDYRNAHFVWSTSRPAGTEGGRYQECAASQGIFTKP
ncbi:MAG: matrixin family metalloprotease [Deltaproteobacteria bacterium]|nr:matrixin family metalloprotease [Deltaproteobacteria bacterium]